MITSILALTAGAMFAAPADGSSADLVSAPTELIANYDLDTLEGLLRELGLASKKGLSNGEPYLAARYRDLDFIVTPEACRGEAKTDCRGAHLIAVFQGRAFDQRAVNRFNATFAFASAGLDPSGDAFISRYEICDYGAPRGNFALGVAVFVNLALRYRDMLSETAPAEARAQTVSLSETAQEAGLRQSAIHFDGGAAFSLLEDSEAAVARRGRLIADPATPRNRLWSGAER